MGSVLDRPRLPTGCAAPSSGARCAQRSCEHARHGREEIMTTAIRHSLAATAIAALLAVALTAPGLAQQKFKALSVKTPDGLTIAAQEWGNPNGPEILFIHGFSQSGMSWAKQVNSDLAKEFHMVTYDLRGHGNSDKPLEPERYRNGKAWA